MGVTIAVVVKVNDGFVLASDSATTMRKVVITPGNPPQLVTNIYNNANKIFNLRKGLPISAMTWGQGNIDVASIATLAKDLRARFTDESDDWFLKPDTYQMAEVAARFKEFFYDEHYEPYATANPGNVGLLGLLVSGYSAKADQPEIYSFELTLGGCVGPTPEVENTTGASWWGQPEAITRVMRGHSQFLPQVLIDLGVDPNQAQPFTDEIAKRVHHQLVEPAMPIQDAVDLAEFLVRLTIEFVRFCPGDATVGGPIEIAAVTKHEGFKWVRRKHYFDSKLNPPVREDIS